MVIGFGIGSGVGRHTQRANRTIARRRLHWLQRKVWSRARPEAESRQAAVTAENVKRFVATAAPADRLLYSKGTEPAARGKIGWRPRSADSGRRSCMLYFFLSLSLSLSLPPLFFSLSLSLFLHRDIGILSFTQFFPSVVALRFRNKRTVSIIFPFEKRRCLLRPMARERCTMRATRGSVKEWPLRDGPRPPGVGGSGARRVVGEKSRLYRARGRRWMVWTVWCMLATSYARVRIYIHVRALIRSCMRL